MFYIHKYLLHTTATRANKCQESCANILWPLLKAKLLAIPSFYEIESQKRFKPNLLSKKWQCVQKDNLLSNA